MFKTFKSFVVILPACALLMACAHAPDPDPVVEEDVAETIDLTTGQNVEKMREIVEGRRNLMNLSVLSNNISDGRVQVYDPAGGDLVMDGPSMDQQRTAAVAADVQGVLVNDSVLIFPIEGTAPPIQPAGAASVEQQVNTDYIAVALGNGQSLKVHFDHNSAFIRPSNKGVLDTIAQDAEDQVGGVSVEGHASRHNMSGDPTRRIMGNLKISMNRAYNVARELVRRGVPADSIRLVGWGETQLPSTGADGENARRVEVKPLSQSR